MNNQKKLTLAYLFTLLSLAASQRDWLRDIMKPWPSLWKIIMSVIAGVFVTAVLLHGLDLLPEFLAIFNIRL